MNKKSFIGSIAGTITFLIFVVVFDKFTEPERFNSENYWFKLAFFGVVMFVVYLFADRYKNLTWKNLFGKKSNSQPTTNNQ